MGIWGAAAGAGSLVGVLLGGTLTELLGWRSVFWTPVPLGLLAGVIVWRMRPAGTGRPGRFAAAAALSFTLGISARALGLGTAGGPGWPAPGGRGPLAVSAVALATFVVVEQRSTHPLVPLGVFRRSEVTVPSAVVVLVGATLASLFFFLPLYQQDVLGMGALRSEEHTSELQSRGHLVYRLLLEKKNTSS